MNRKALGTFVLVVLGGCAVRLGGPKPEDYPTLALAAPAAATAAEVVARIQEVGPKLVLLSAAQDSAWFESVAAQTGLGLSGPGRTPGASLAFLTRDLELLGDTTIALNVNGGGRIYMHDALYQISKDRLIDLMLVSMEQQADVRESVRSLLAYVASDVSNSAAVVLGLRAPQRSMVDSAAVLMRAYFANALECARSSTDDGASAPAPLDLRLFYGPAVLMECRSARVLDGNGPAVSAQLIVGR